MQLSFGRRRREMLALGCRKFIGNDNLVIYPFERSRHPDKGRVAMIVNVLLTVLMLGAAGSFLRATFLILD
jgi:hypothetical protein